MKLTRRGFMMNKHRHTEPAKENFAKLVERIMAINDPILGKYKSVKRIFDEVSEQNRPVLVMATGGSKVVAYYLQLILESAYNKIVCEIIEPRDYFYKVNKDSFSTLIAISASGKTHGIEEALADFEGKKYLICEKEKEASYDVISWGNELYKREKSFISLATSLGPINLLLDVASSINRKTNAEEIEKTNKKIKKLLTKSANKIDEIQIDFKKTDILQIMSGYDTKTSSSVLESNLVEVGLAAPVIHDKGSYCHGRSNLLFRYPNSHMIYLSHKLKDLDYMLIETIKNKYSNLIVFDTEDLEENIFWKEYYLILQMYFLSKKIAEDKGIDLTMPEYDLSLIEKMYNYKGEM